MKSGKPREKHSSWRKANRQLPQSTTTEFGVRGRDRRTLLFMVSALGTLVMGLLVALVITLLKRPDLDVPVIVASVTSSKPRNPDDQLSTPPIPFAKEDAEVLGTWTEQSELIRSVTGVLHQESKQKSELLDAILRPLRRSDFVSGGRGGKNVAVFINAQGIVHDGDPYLLVGNSLPQDASTWIRFQDLMEQIEEQCVESDCRALIFLDPSRAGAAWDWGNVDRSLTSRCESIASQLDHVAVIVSAEDGEWSWWDPRGGHSLFVRSILRCLTDSGDLDGDGDVTVGEIEERLRRQVSRDALAIWDASQHPKLITENARSWKFIQQSGQQFELPATNVNSQAVIDFFSQSQALWSRHNALASSQHPPVSVSPLRWSQLEKQLSRIDSLILAGQSRHEELRQMINACDKQLIQFERGSEYFPNRGEVPELLLDEYFHGPSATSDVANEVIKAWTKTPDPSKFQQPPDFGSEDDVTAQVCWPWLMKDRDDQFAGDKLKLAGKLLRRDEFEHATPADYLETHLLRLRTAADMEHVPDEYWQTILKTHVRSRYAAFTRDLRAYFWIHETLHELDRKRMTYVDALLSHVESRNAQEDLQNLIDSPESQASKSYQQITDDGELISEAYYTRDAMLHEVPRIAETLLTYPEAFQDTEDFSQTVLTQFQKSTDAVRCLTSQLRYSDSDDKTYADRIQQINSSLARAKIEWIALRDILDEQVDRVITTDVGDASGLYRAYALLNGSGVSDAEQRKNLYDRICEILFETAGPVESRAAKPPPDERDSHLPSSFLINGQHPLRFWIESTKPSAIGCVASNVKLAALDPISPATGDVGQDESESRRTLDQNGQEIRSELSQLMISGDSLDVSEVVQTLARDDGSGLAVAHQMIEDPELALRARTILMSNAPHLSQSICDRRLSADVQMFLLDHAKRTLNEFWCGADANDEVFFAKATSKLLNSRRGRDPIVLGTSLGQIDLRDQQRHFLDQANDSETLKATPIGQFRNGGLLKELRNQEVEFEFHFDSKLPQGQIDVWTEKHGRRQLLLPSRKSRSDFIIPTSLSQADEKYPVKSFFRGLRREGALKLKHLGTPNTVVVSPPNYGPPTATVRRQDESPENIILVFDCSSSMGTTKLREARNALMGLLGNLPPNANVGLIMFGHRFGWVQNANGKLVQGRKAKHFKVKQGANIRQEEIRLDDKDAIFNPNFDVEIVVPLGSLGDQQPKIENAITQAQAVGNTPTYLAIDSAFGQLGQEGGHVIVLTDGKPFLSLYENEKQISQTPPSRLQQETLDRSLDSQRDSRLTIVAFATEDINDFFEDYPNCSILDASLGELGKVLQSTVQRRRFGWLHDGESVSDSIQTNKKRVFVPVDRDSWPPRGIAPGHPVRPAERYEVQLKEPDGTIVANTTVEVEGGEAFELEVVDDELRHLPFQRDQEEHQVLAPEGPSAEKFSVLALQPNLFEGRNLTLDLAIETTTQGKFTPRPSDVWIELIASDRQRRRKARFVCTALHFVSNRQVPVLRCQIDWPDWATGDIRIEGWLRFNDPKAEKLEFPLNKPNSFTMDNIEGVTFRTDHSTDDGYQISIVEKHEVGFPIDRFRLQTIPPPTEGSSVRYYPAITPDDQGIVERVYRYRERPDKAYISTKEQIVKGASLHISGTAPPIRDR